MDKDLRDKWVAALRSGEYQQGSGALRAPSEDGDRFCCLGVLCDLVAPDKWSEGPLYTDTGIEAAYEHDGPFHGLPNIEVLRHADLDMYLAYKLSNMNDAGRGFAYIANAIERWLV